MSLQRNILEQVKRDAVTTARGGDPRLTALGANRTASGTSIGTIGAEQMTRPDADGRTIGPYIVDESPLDDPLFYVL